MLQVSGGLTSRICSGPRLNHHRRYLHHHYWSTIKSTQRSEAAAKDMEKKTRRRVSLNLIVCVWIIWYFYEDSRNGCIPMISLSLTFSVSWSFIRSLPLNSMIDFLRMTQWYAKVSWRSYSKNRSKLIKRRSSWLLLSSLPYFICYSLASYICIIWIACLSLKSTEVIALPTKTS